MPDIKAKRLNTSNSYQIGRHFFTSNAEGKPFVGPYDDHDQGFFLVLIGCILFDLRI